MAKDQIGSISQRAEQIDKVRDLTVLGVTKQIRSRSQDPKLTARVATAWLLQNHLYCISESDWERICSKKILD